MHLHKSQGLMSGENRKAGERKRKEERERESRLVDREEDVKMTQYRQGKREEMLLRQGNSKCQSCFCDLVLTLQRRFRLQ